MSRITILGTGYIGTSIGLALKASKVNVEVIGHDRDLNRASEGRKRGAFDKVEWNLPAALEKASLVIVATPLGAMEKLFSQMVDFLEPGCIVTDTASLKGATLEWATTAFAGRASFVGGVNPYGTGACGAAAPCVNYLNPAAFTLPAAGTFGNVGKGSLRGPNLINWDTGIFKEFPLRGERVKLQFRGEFFNVLNRVNFNNPNLTFTAGGFGSITSAADPRIGQLALKVVF